MIKFRKLGLTHINWFWWRDDLHTRQDDGRQSFSFPPTLIWSSFNLSQKKKVVVSLKRNFFLSAFIFLFVFVRFYTILELNKENVRRRKLTFHLENLHKKKNPWKKFFISSIFYKCDLVWEQRRLSVVAWNVVTMITPKKNGTTIRMRGIKEIRTGIWKMKKKIRKKKKNKKNKSWWYERQKIFKCIFNKNQSSFTQNF